MQVSAASGVWCVYTCSSAVLAMFIIHSGACRCVHGAMLDSAATTVIDGASVVLLVTIALTALLQPRIVSTTVAKHRALVCPGVRSSTTAHMLDGMFVVLSGMALVILARAQAQGHDNVFAQMMNQLPRVCVVSMPGACVVPLSV